MSHQCGVLDGSRAYAELIETGTTWADAEAAASLLEETKKSVLSDLRLRFVDEKTESAREARALAHEDYRDHLTKMVEARHAAHLARVRYDAIRALIDMRRTEAATLREQARLAGIQP